MEMDHPNATAVNDLELMLLDETAEPRALPLSLLQDITNGFSKDREIGRGGFGVVYRGILGNGTVVAVKRLSQRTYIDENKFMREVECLMKVKHKNIVRFLGYCAESQGNVMSHNGKLVMADEQRRLFCFEYLSKGNLRDYITNGPCKLEWRKCYKIIKGICQGLHYLHENNIVHLDLKPENVLLDDHMVPKIADFGLSRCFEEKQTSQSITSNIGTMGYIAPELYSGEKITMKSDIFSLGIVIKEILTGNKWNPDDVKTVLESWSTRLEEETQFEQVHICTDIGIECSEFNPKKRPVTMQPIIKRLQAMEPVDEVHGFHVHPHILYFPSAANELIPSLLYLNNNTDEHVAFRLVENSTTLVTCCFARLPLYGIVAPRSTYSLAVSTDTLKEKFIYLTLESCTLGNAHVVEEMSSNRLEEFIEAAKNMGDMVQKVTLKAVATAEPDITCEEIPLVMKTLRVHKARWDDAVACIDVNPTKEWVITGHKNGVIRIWNYQTERKVHWFKVSNETVRAVKFFVQKKWFVSASEDGFIHVYNYERKMHKITSFRGGTVVAIHPSKPYLLSASYCRKAVELWGWDKDWGCTQIFEIDHGGEPAQVMFNPKDTNTFAITFKKCKVVEVGTVDSPRFKYTLCGHIGIVNCLDFFTTDDQQHLITGSSDCSAKIWDLQNYMCIYTLQASSSIRSVLFNPNRQVLITGSEDGNAWLWSSTNFRLERIINTGTHLGFFWGLTYFMRSTGVFIIGQGSTIQMMDINDFICKEEPRHSNESRFISYMRPGDTTTDQHSTLLAQERLVEVDFQAKMILDDVELLDVHPLELRFDSPYHTTMQMHLTNKTDESVAFRLWENEVDPCLLPDYVQRKCGIIPSKCTFTLLLRRNRWLKFEEETSSNLFVQSIISRDNYIVPLQYLYQCDELFEELIEVGNTVHEVALRAVSQGEIISLYHRNVEYGFIQDAHPTETWILETHRSRYVRIRDVVTEEVISEVELDKGIDVQCGKFIGRMQWFLIGTSDGFIHAYTYGTKIIREITSFQASTSQVTLAAIHPTQPYVLSSGKDSQMKLWNWEVNGSDWECTQIYEDEHSDDICEVTFSQVKDTKTFASASRDHTVKVWSLDSPKSKYTLFGHLDAVTCLDFFRLGDKQYLVSASDDGSVRIWDLQNWTCVHTTDLLSRVVAVRSLPDRPYLIIGLEDATVHLWSSALFRSDRIFSIARPGDSVCSVHVLGLARVVIGHGGIKTSTVWVMDIDNVIKPAGIKGNNEPKKDMDNVCKVGDIVIDTAERLNAFLEAQMDTTHVFEEPKEHVPDTQCARAVSHMDRNNLMNYPEAYDVSQLSAHEIMEAAAWLSELCHAAKRSEEG